MNRTTLITGGSRGIGLAVVKRVAESGDDVVIIDRDPPPEEFRSSWIGADLGDPEDTARALAEASGRGEIAALVNNVGTVRPATIEDASLDDLAVVVSLNLRCSLQACQSVVPGMRERNYGRIVNVTSRAALGKLGRSVYAGTKAGLHGMTRTWALELAGSGITANSVAPGPIATELFEQVNPPGEPRTQAILDSIPAGRMGTPEDVAQAVASFLDPRAGFITGQILYVCGGITVGLS